MFHCMSMASSYTSCGPLNRTGPADDDSRAKRPLMHLATVDGDP